MFTRRLNRLLGGRAAAVWMFDRRARELELQAATGRVPVPIGQRVSTAIARQPAARFLRERAPRRTRLAAPFLDSRGTGLVVPLHGRRRALGLVVIDTGDSGAAAKAADIWRLDVAEWVGRHLAIAVENVQLFAGAIRARRELEHTFDSIADLVAVFDKRLRIVEVNHALASRIGRPAHELRDHPLHEVTGEATHAWIASRATASRAGVKTEQVEDERWQGIFSVSVSTRLNERGASVGGVLVARDVTEDARLEAERTSLRERLSQAEKLAALGQFVAGVAHELNNPLQGLMGHIELVQRTGELSKEAAKDLRIAFREADRAAKIVRNLLVFAGAQAKPRRRVSLNAIVSRALALRAPACRSAGIEIVRRLAPRLPRVRGDALLLHQAFLNIITNAESAMHASDTRRLEVRTSVNRAGDQVIIRIIDSGPGIPPDVLPRIFEPFYTTKEVGKGTGLGLAITFGIVHDHGGHIYAENGANGASFTVHLPSDKTGLATESKGR
jgi:two-component system NtrC family sensor kinase